MPDSGERVLAFGQHPLDIGVIVVVNRGVDGDPDDLRRRDRRVADGGEPERPGRQALRDQLLQARFVQRRLALLERRDPFAIAVQGEHRPLGVG